MSERRAEEKQIRRVRHKGRGSQIRIYLGKQIRFFVNQNDWKVLPMAAIIAALVGMVISKRFFINMEGSLMGAFALTCVSIWNGCFNSIQSVCRERPIVKREHRSGMHISSYVMAHMIYQFMLCTLQTGLSIYVLQVVGVKFPEKGFITSSMLIDIGITMLLISYASDMMSLFISSMAHTTTGAMTVMPFVLIFQLVFSGGIIPLPEWSQSISNFTISNYGIHALASQSEYNQMPMVTAWNTLSGMKNNEIGGTYTIGEALDLLEAPGLKKYRDTVVIPAITAEEAINMLNSADRVLHLREVEILRPFTLREIGDVLINHEEFQSIRDLQVFPDASGNEGGLSLGRLLQTVMNLEGAEKLLDTEIGTNMNLGQALDLLRVEEAAKAAGDQKLNPAVTLGDVLDFLKNNEEIQAHRNMTFTLKTTIGELMDLIGEEKVRTIVQEKTAQAAYKEEYETSLENIVGNWIMLFGFILFFALCSVISLELIDRDKR